MLQTAWSYQTPTRKVKYDFVVYYNEEVERYIPVYDPNRLPEFMESSFLPSEKQKVFEALLIEGEGYDPEKHEGHLRCPDGCNAHMKYHDASENHSSRFRVDKESEQPKHKKGCKHKPPQKDRRIEIDSSESRGVIERQFNHRASNHIQNRLHHSMTRHDYEDLIGRKVKHARTAADFLKILKKDNLKKDIFTDQHQIIKGTEFFVQDRQDIKSLYHQIEEAPHVTRFRAVIFRVTTPVEKLQPSDKMSVTAHREFYFQQSEETAYDGAKHFIVLRALPEQPGQDNARLCFPVAGEYLVTGDVTAGDVIMRDDVVIHYMDIKIRTPDQVIKVDIDLTPQSNPENGSSSRNMRREP